VGELLEAVLPAASDDRSISLALAISVDNARYWQPPDGEDLLAATPELYSPIARVATDVLGAPETTWWTDSACLPEQWVVNFANETSESRIDSGSATEILARWHDTQVEEEAAARRDRPTDPTASWGSTWWSKPPSALTRTTRSLGNRGPVGLWLVEDAFESERASAEHVRVAPDARIYEIDSPDAWAELCRRYPLKATASRRHDWYRATGRNGHWVIPDWTLVARDFDAVHLSVAGYLTTAGCAVPVDDDVASVLAGWDPDQTYWLSDIPHLAETRQSWVRTPGEATWREVKTP
jgi:hypothetical protein